MIKSLLSDAIFIATVFAETLAGLFFLEHFQAVALPEAMEPVRAFYENALPILAPGAYFARSFAPAWLASASIVASALFFHFFIAQARRASAPYQPPEKQLERAEALVDWALPAVACAAGAVITAPTLAPFLTVPAAFYLLARRLGGRDCWFALPTSYFTNLICAGLTLLGILVLLR